jgi:serralysin
MRDANASLHSTGNLTSANLVLVGDPPSGSNDFIYTNEYMADAAADPARETLNDPAGGSDTLNLAAVSADCVINLTPGGAGAIGGIPFTIGAGTTIGTLYTGAGRDVVEMSGDSGTIIAEGGNDTIYFPDAKSSYALVRSNDQVTVTQGGITDLLTGVSVLEFADATVAASSIPCFAAGTNVLTARGEAPVESLRVGDWLPTLTGERLARIRWIGHCAARVRPVCIGPGAFGDGTPHRALLVSPDHALFVNGALIPAQALINGASIAESPGEGADYWHIELDRHAAIAAEGMASESYLDTGNKAGLAPPGVPADADDRRAAPKP